jgi:catechol 2,3-dioxygenase-like lactoylglutathione lyase family enzyme
MAGVPGLRGTDHIGFTVPDIEAATKFFVEVIGCELVYSLGRIEDSKGDWMRRHLNVDPSSVIKDIRLFRCRHGSNFEIFEYQTPDQVRAQPRNSDVGGHHLAFYVDDMQEAIAYLLQHDVRILGEPTRRTSGPSAGQTWVYFLSPWGMQMELVTFPEGKAYEQDAAVHLWHPARPAD